MKKRKIAKIIIEKDGIYFKYYRSHFEGWSEEIIYEYIKNIVIYGHEKMKDGKYVKI